MKSILAIGLVSALLISCGEDGVAAKDNTSISSSSGEGNSSRGGSYTGGDLPEPASGTILIDHRTTKLSAIPNSAIEDAIDELVVAYGHTSHGSQITEGMKGLEEWKGAPYLFGDNGIDIREGVFSSASDLGNPNFTAWPSATREYLNAHIEVNVIMWSWCGQVADASDKNIQGYLDSMSALEEAYPNVKFVYMTGHLNGTGVDGTLHKNNQKIRTYVREHGKILYDFADIESYDPDGNEYLSLNANDNCGYDGGNWCTAWQNAHPGEWFDMSAQHSQPLNGNLKAYAAWHLFARLAGWDGE